MTTVLVTFAWERVRELAERHSDVEFLEVKASGQLERNMGGDGVKRDGVGGETSNTATHLESMKATTPEGEVLLTSPQGVDGLAEILEAGVRWVHVVGTGVDRFPIELLGEQLLTCSRGASAVPISEWAMAHILAEAKHLPEAWVTEKPERWFDPQTHPTHHMHPSHPCL